MIFAATTSNGGVVRRRAYGRSSASGNTYREVKQAAHAAGEDDPIFEQIPKFDERFIGSGHGRLRPFLCGNRPAVYDGSREAQICASLSDERAACRPLVAERGCSRLPPKSGMNARA